MSENIKKISNPYSLKIIYIMRFFDNKHEDMLKIGETTLKIESNDIGNYSKNSKQLNEKAKKRIKQIANTSANEYEILYVDLGKTNNGVTPSYFSDKTVHALLENSGYDHIKFDYSTAREWFKIDINTAIEAIECVKQGKKTLSGSNTNIRNINPIKLTPAQITALEMTSTRFKLNDQYLWNAKMRFGKTIAALQLIKEMNFKKILIITHRPDVNDGWYEDFNNIFYNSANDYHFNKKESRLTVQDLNNAKKNYIYFASLQDLGGSKIVGGMHNKNDDVFNNDWDFIIVDEAHEGTTTELGQLILNKLRKPLNRAKPKCLELSGTPFNILGNYNTNEIFNWTYSDEQKAKREWYPYNFPESNPYDGLPSMNIYTYDLAKHLKKNPLLLDNEKKAFSFTQFFKIWTGHVAIDREEIPNQSLIGKFMYEKDVLNFLNLLVTENDSNYPFSTEQNRNFLKHTFWSVPGVKEAKALQELLERHCVFGQYFEIINVAGEGNALESETKKALDRVKKGINRANLVGKNTITLSCGRLTTGVTVPEWTGVLMLSGGGNDTSAASYLQTIFRVQSPHADGTFKKEQCYVFDFAPDRTLQMISILATKRVADDNSLSIIERQLEDKKLLNQFINFCPVISYDGSTLKKYDIDKFMHQLKQYQIQNAVEKGFDDTCLFNMDLIKGNFSDADLDIFKELSNVMSAGEAKKITKIELVKSNLTDIEHEIANNAREKDELSRTEEEKKLISEQDKEFEGRKEAARLLVRLLRVVATKLPLLVYGMSVITDNITLDMFLDERFLSKEDWDEFLPKELTRERFAELIKFFDTDVFIGACNMILSKVKSADLLNIEDRIKVITNLFNTFRNPDKETILTPWWVVNMHMASTLGGYNWFSEKNRKDCLESPIHNNSFEEVHNVFDDLDSKILEINSKTGLYPLYAAYSIFSARVKKLNKSIEDVNIEVQNELWKKTVEKNIFILCKTKMAEKIAIRTVSGYKDIKVNTYTPKNLIDNLKKEQHKMVKTILKSKKWNQEGEIQMKFDAVIGNPPYQGVNHQQIYTLFYLLSREIGDMFSLIFPIGWQEPKKANLLSKLNNEEIKADKQIVFIDNRQNVFEGIAGAEWTNLVLWKKEYDNRKNGLQRVFTNGKDEIVKKLIWDQNEIWKPVEIEQLKKIIVSKCRSFLSSYTSALKPYGLRTNFLDDPSEYGLPGISDVRENNTDLKIYGLKNRKQVEMYVPFDYPIPKFTNNLNAFKILVGKAWGNFSKPYLGGAYSDIIVARPREICTENFLESGSFSNAQHASFHAKYLLTKFCRALLFANKHTIDNSKDKWISVPMQEYTENWWKLSIAEIDEKLFEKYNIPNNIKDYVYKNVQTKTEKNIVNFYKGEK